MEQVNQSVIGKHDIGLTSELCLQEIAERLLPDGDLMRLSFARVNSLAELGDWERYFEELGITGTTHIKEDILSIIFIIQVVIEVREGIRYRWNLPQTPDLLNRVESKFSLELSTIY